MTTARSTPGIATTERAFVLPICVDEEASSASFAVLLASAGAVFSVAGVVLIAIEAIGPGTDE